MAPFVGLTGGIGAGKSTALAALKRLGAATLSTDQVVHELYDDNEVRSAVTERFGERVLADDKVDRAEVARVAFATNVDREWLERLLWPRVGQRMLAWRAEADSREPAPRALVAEVPLLFESGLAGAFEATIAVLAPEELRADRAAGRGHEAVDERHSRQLTQEEKRRRATYAVENDGDVEELERKLSAVLDMLN